MNTFLLAIIILNNGVEHSSYEQHVQSYEQCQEVSRLIEAELNYWQPNTFTLEYECHEEIR